MKAESSNWDLSVLNTSKRKERHIREMAALITNKKIINSLIGNLPVYKHYTHLVLNNRFMNYNSE